MKRKIFILSTAALVAISGFNMCYAVDKVTTEDIKLPEKEHTAVDTVDDRPRAVFTIGPKNKFNKTLTP